MLSKEIERRAAEVLPACKTLTDAERAFGGLYDEETSTRDHKPAAITWGLFDGFKGRPNTPSGVHASQVSTYHEAYAAGQRISMAELPA